VFAADSARAGSRLSEASTTLHITLSIAEGRRNNHACPIRYLHIWRIFPDEVR
jgi:hypothetical protein